MIEKKIRISCLSTINRLKTKALGRMWRSWKVSIRPVDTDAKNALDVYIDHVEYILHESFETARINCTEGPYTLEQEGWGEFDLGIIFHFKDSTIPPQSMIFDLNFKRPKYSVYKSLELNEGYLLSQQQNLPVKNTRKRSASATSSLEEARGDHGSKIKKVTRERGLSSASSSNSIMAPASSTKVAIPPLVRDGDLLPYHHHDLQQEQMQKEQQQQLYYEDYCRSSSQKQTTQLHNEYNNAITHSNINEQRAGHFLDRRISVSSSSSNSSSGSSDNNNDYHDHSWNAAIDEIPKEINMPVLGKSLESLNDDNLRKVYNIIFNNPEQNNGIKMQIVETEDHVLFDLYSLDIWTLRKLWIFTRNVERAATEAE